MTDGGKGQESFEVMFEERGIGAEHQGGQASRSHDVKPQFRPCQCRVHPRQQKDAGFYHGGGMQIGETGVGADMAWGSQKWNGNWADLVKAPSSIRHRAAGDRLWERIRSRVASITPGLRLRTISPSNRAPAREGRPPPP